LTSNFGDGLGAEGMNNSQAKALVNAFATFKDMSKGSAHVTDDDVEEQFENRKMNLNRRESNASPFGRDSSFLASNRSSNQSPRGQSLNIPTM